MPAQNTVTCYESHPRRRKMAPQKPENRRMTRSIRDGKGSRYLERRRRSCMPMSTQRAPHIRGVRGNRILKRSRLTAFARRSSTMAKNAGESPCTVRATVSFTTQPREKCGRRPSKEVARPTAPWYFPPTPQTFRSVARRTWRCFLRILSISCERDWSRPRSRASSGFLGPLVEGA